MSTNRKILTEKYMNLKDKLGRIPTIMDFYEVKKCEGEVDIMGEFVFDYDAAANYWVQKDADSKQMDRQRLIDRIYKFLNEHNTCTLGTASEGQVRCTPIEYNFVDEKLYFFSEGGQKFR